MSLRREMVALATADGANVSEVARRFGVSRKTLYKWVSRSSSSGGPIAVPADPWADRSRRPSSSPGRTDAEVESAVLAVRDAHPAWGGRKIRAVLLRRGAVAADRVPSASTITSVLRRHDRLTADACEAAAHHVRFERPAPNDLWQADFKGDFALCGPSGGRCHPLTATDDHSRYNLILDACADQRRPTVQAAFTRAFERYGLPRVMLMDNGTPWGIAHDPACYTGLEVWLMRLDVRVIHGRPYHPQTQGKEERFHRTLNVELLQGRQFATHAEAQVAFDPYRVQYNHDRPHEALGMAVPAARYVPSPRRYPPGGTDALPPLAYAGGDQVRVPNRVGQTSFRGRSYKLSEAFAGQRLGLRPTATDGVWDAYFGRFRVAVVDERDGSARMVRP